MYASWGSYLCPLNTPVVRRPASRFQRVATANSLFQHALFRQFPVLLFRQPDHLPEDLLRVPTQERRRRVEVTRGQGQDEFTAVGGVELPSPRAPSSCSVPGG